MKGELTSENTEPGLTPSINPHQDKRPLPKRAPELALESGPEGDTRTQTRPKMGEHMAADDVVALASGLTGRETVWLELREQMKKVLGGRALHPPSPMLSLLSS